jgi:outer membrane protein OmpA-like peptidoglycan-associated protein
MNTRIHRLAAVFAAPALLAACASAPPNEQLQQARNLYEQVEDDPQVVRSGAVALNRAQEELRIAEQLFANDADKELVDHHAYLAEQYARIAVEEARQAELTEEISTAEERREQLVLQQRTREAQTTQAEAEALRRQLQQMEAESTERGMVLTLGDVLFESGEATLQGSAVRTIDELAEFLENNPERRVLVEGYTDSVGSASMNQQLSEQRAQAVADALIARGISPDRIETRGYGEDFPVAPNDSAANRQRNRRVEVVISDAQGNLQSR